MNEPDRARLLPRWALVLVIVLILDGCSTNPFEHQDQYVFKPMAAYADVTFHVLDRRQKASKNYRAAEQSPASYVYGDDQFIPRSHYVVASHFAAAFPRAPTETRLVIDHLEIKNYMPRPTGDGGRSASGWADALGRVLENALRSPEKNHIACRLTGSFAQIPFDVTQHVDYDRPGSVEFSRAVNSAMLTAITEAIQQVRKHSPSIAR